MIEKVLQIIIDDLKKVNADLTSTADEQATSNLLSLQTITGLQEEQKKRDERHDLVLADNGRLREDLVFLGSQVEEQRRLLSMADQVVILCNRAVAARSVDWRALTNALAPYTQRRSGLHSEDPA